MKDCAKEHSKGKTEKLTDLCQISMDFLQTTSVICIQKIPFQRYLWRLSIRPRSGGTNFPRSVHFPSQRTTSIYVFPKSKITSQWPYSLMETYRPEVSYMDQKLLIILALFLVFQIFYPNLWNKNNSPWCKSWQNSMIQNGAYVTWKYLSNGCFYVLQNGPVDVQLIKCFKISGSPPSPRQKSS